MISRFLIRLAVGLSPFPVADLQPVWIGDGKLGWRWRLTMALRALAGYELHGFKDAD